MNDADLDALLRALPATAPVPPGLDDAVLATLARAPASSAIPRLAIAAAILLGVGLGALAGPVLRPAPTLLLTRGSQLVEGRALVLAGDRQVRIDGRARVSVEPPEGLAREGEQEAHNAMLDSTHAIAALAGSFITVAVYQGFATVSEPGEAPITVSAGEEHTVGPPPRPGG